MKQPPIVINNIIKPEDSRHHDISKYERYLHYSGNEFAESFRQRDSIDDRLEYKEMMIRKLESERRSNFNNTIKINNPPEKSSSPRMAETQPVERQSFSR